MRSIFISYRRNDTEGEAGRLFDDLVSEFGENSVFMDVAAIEAGRDFRKVIDESVATCGVLLAIIGKNWVDAKDDNGQRRLDDATDFVRLETASALRRDIPVIPILVRGAKMPRAEELPEDLRDLAYRNCVELTHARWNSDLELLTNALRRQLKIEKSGPVPPVPEPDGGGTAGGGSGHKSDDRPVTPTPSPSPEPKNRLIYIVSLAMIVAIALGAYFFVNRQVTVPDLRGDTIALATSKLQASRLKVGQTTVRQDPTVDPNLVLSQYPPSDERVKSGTAIDLIVSAATAQVEVPAVTGQMLDNALHTLAEHQVVVGDVQRQARAGVARDTILQQFPQAGEMVKVNGKIDLLVSDQPPSAEAATPPSPGAARNADADWAKARSVERAAAKQAALKAASAKVAADKGVVDKAAANQPAAAGAGNGAAESAAPKVVIRSASCKILGPGKYRLDIMGDVTVPPLDTYLFYTWASVGSAGTRWRPECKGWSMPTSADDSLWEVSCIHRSSDMPQMSWQTSRIITSQNNQPPTTGGTTLFKPGMQAPSSLKFNVTCQ
ncbi:MAG TPA: PASTA domain-containing protein [Terriglobales bacterium]